MERYLSTPIPNLKGTPQPASETERLKVILRNIESRRYQVHANILHSAQVKIIASQQEGSGDHVMTSRNANGSTDPEKLPDAPDSDSFPDGVDEAFFASLSAPYVEGSGDPSFAHGSVSSPNGQGAQGSISTQHNSARLAVVLEALKAVEEYDTTFRKTRESYIEALKRAEGKHQMNGGSHTNGARQSVPQTRRASVPHAQTVSPVTAPGLERRVTTGPTESAAGFTDAARDPRTRR